MKPNNLLLAILFLTSFSAFSNPEGYNLALRAAKRLYNRSIPLVQDELQFIRKLSLRADIEDSFHTVDICSLVDRLTLWQKHLPQVEVHYAVKTNHDKLISSTMAALGTGFDCASLGEIRQVLSLGIDPEKIIFSHPRKPIREIIYAEENHVKKKVFDSIEELDKMRRFAPNGEFVLRIKTDDEHSETPLSAKFGASQENAYRILDYAFKNRVHVIGVSFHVGSNNMDKTAYSKAIRDASLLFNYSQKSWNIELKLLDIGGGWPGNNDERFIEFADTVKQALGEYFPKGVRFIAEPGRYFATKTTTAALRVIGTEQLETPQGSKWAYHLSNGAYGLFSASIYFQFDAQKLASEDWSFHPLLPKNDSTKTCPSIFWGPTCDSEDKILDNILFPHLGLNEFIYSQNVGSYSYSGQTAFNQITPSRAYYICKSIPSAL